MATWTIAWFNPIVTIMQRGEKPTIKTPMRDAVAIPPWDGTAFSFISIRSMGVRMRGGWDDSGYAYPYLLRSRPLFEPKGTNATHLFAAEDFCVGISP